MTSTNGEKDENNNKSIRLPAFDPLRYNFWAKQVSLTFQLHKLLDIVEGRETDSFPDAQEPYENLNNNEKKTVRIWRHRHTQAHEALMNSIQKTPAESEVFSSSSAIEIWAGLKRTYGFKSVMTAALAEGNYTSFRKSPTSTMREHIAQFERLLQEHEYHRLTNEPIHSAYKNVALMNSICLTNNNDTDKWQTWFNSSQDTLDDMPFPVLCAKLRAYAERGNQMFQSASTAQPADKSSISTGNTAPVEANSLEKRMYQNSDRGGGRRGRGGYRGKYRGHDRGGRNRHGKQAGRGRSRSGNRSGHSRGFENGGREKNAKCRHCGRTNHPEEDCWFKNGRTDDRDRNDRDRDPWGYNSRREHQTNVVIYSSVRQTADPHTWVYDTGSNAHIQPFKNRIQNYKPFEMQEAVYGVGGRQSKALGIGSVTMTDPQGRKYAVQEVLYVPDAEKPILSMAKALRQGLTPIFKEGGEFLLSARSNSFTLQGNTIDDILYVYEVETPHQTFAVETRAQKQKMLVHDEDEDEEDFDSDSDYSVPDQSPPISDHQVSPSTPSSNPPQKRKKSSNEVDWHLRLGHTATSTLQRIFGRNYEPENTRCTACVIAKTTRSPFPKRREQSTQKLELVHSDLCGPNPPSHGGNIYFITFIDDYSRYCWVYTIKRKSAAAILAPFQQFIKDAENKAECKVKSMRTDGGGEYEKETAAFMKSQGIEPLPSAPYSPESNGIAERLNRTLNEMVRAMLFQANMPQSFWGEAIIVAAEIKNLLPHAALDFKTPHEVFFGKPPSYDHIKPFGCLVDVHIPKQRQLSRSKYDPRATEACFIRRVAPGNYKIWDFTRRTITSSHDITCRENEFPTEDYFTDSPPVRPPRTRAPRAAILPPLVEPIPPISPSTTADPLPVYDEIVVLDPPPALEVYTTNTDDSDPVSYADAMSRPDASLWLKAMEEELVSINKNDTWKLCELPPDRKAIGTKWVLKKKIEADGSVRYKARIVAKGYAQVAELDYNDTYAPVVRIESVRVFLAIVAFFNLYMIQGDFVTAFLNSVADITLFLTQPEGFIHKRLRHHVLRLNKSLYGLKQAPRLWYMRLCEYIISLGYRVCDCDSSIYYNKTLRIIILVYVDDMLIAGPCKATCDKIYDQLNAKFPMKHLGSPRKFLGLRITRELSTISIHQAPYIMSMLSRFQMTDCVPAQTPLDPSLPLLYANGNEKRCNQRLYQEIMGSLNHLAVYSRPDISFAVSRLSQFNKDPTETHLKAARHILRYLKHTMDLYITYGNAASLNPNAYSDNGWLPEWPDTIDPQGFADADWGSDKNDYKSTTGYVFIINNGPVSWSSHKQSSVALSTYDAEYMAMSDASREAIARSQFFQDLDIKTDVPTLHSDNQAALSTVMSEVPHHRAKHIAIRYHFVRDEYNKSNIAIDYIPTTNQPADILTKALQPSAHERCLRLLNMH